MSIDVSISEVNPLAKGFSEMAKLSAAQHKKAATIKPTKAHPEGRFPIPDKTHARLALQMLPRAKGLTSEQKAKIKAKAERMLGK